MTRENRHHLRVSAQSDNGSSAELFIRSSGNGSEKVRLLDLSTNGAYFEHAGELPEGNVCNAAIRTPDQEHVIICTGTVRRKVEREDGYGYGMELYMNSDDQRTLDLYVMKRI